MLKRKDWVQKLRDSKDLPTVVKISGKMTKRWGTETVGIPASIEVDEVMRKVPKGKLATINHIRQVLAKNTKQLLAVRSLPVFLPALFSERLNRRERKVKRKLLPIGEC